MHQTPPNSDALWMAAALELASQMRGHVWPNPPVGCIIVAGDAEIARGQTQPGGRPHAEIVALARAGGRASGATLYVTLEPCCHWGKTPPCSDTIIAAGIRRVVCAMQDPDPRVNGGGFRKLREVGIEIAVGEGASEAAAIISGFWHRVRTGQPEIILLDDATDAAPPNCDALLVSINGRPELRFQPEVGAVLPDLSPDAGLLSRLGTAGLTSLAVWRDDAAFVNLRI